MRGLSLPRTLIVGLDGATPQLLFPMVESGELPALASLVEGSQHGVLHSVEPPMTLPAWSSFLTGVGPGVHGIVDFAVREDGRLRFLTAADRGVPTLLQRLSDAGAVVGSFLFPTTWPPRALSGGQISGFDSPVATRVPRAACAPPELHDRVRAVLGRDLSFADFSELRKGPRWESAAAAALLRGIEDKERVACALLRERRYDVFAWLFGESDTAAHHAWHLHDPASPRHDAAAAERHGDLLRAVYRRLDAALAAMLDAGGPWDSVVVASDHGFGPASDRVLHLNAYLAEQGLLRWRGANHLAAARAATARALPPAVLEGLVRRLPAGLTERIEGGARWGAIDLPASLAFSDELNYAPSVRLTDAGRQPEATERVVRALLAWRDPVDGRQVVQAVRTREACMPGPLAHRAPELFLQLAEPFGATYNVLPSRVGQPSFGHMPRAAWRGRKGAGMPGSHRREGIYLLRGPGVSPGRRPLSIIDLLPTWLDAAGVGPMPGAPAQSPAPRASTGELALRLARLGYL